MEKDEERITESDLLATLGGVVMALGSVMPPRLCRDWAAALRTTAAAATDDGRTMHGRLLRGLAAACDTAASMPRQ